MTSGEANGHLVPLPGTEWPVWRDGVLRIQLRGPVPAPGSEVAGG